MQYHDALLNATVSLRNRSEYIRMFRVLACNTKYTIFKKITHQETKVAILASITSMD